MAEPELHYGKYRIRWKDENGKRCSQVFESRKEAKAAHKKIVYEVEQIRLGLLKKDNQDILFDALANYWLKHRTSYKKSPKDDQSIIRNHLLPYFTGKAVSKIRASEIDGFKKSLEGRSAKTISNVLTLLVSLMKMAVELEWIVKTPVIKKPSTKLFSKEFRYLQSNEEIKAFLDAAKAENEMIFMLYATALFTGMRQGELAGLKFADIDFERNIIVVSRSFSGPTKSDRVRYVPLMENLKVLLLRWRGQNRNELVFPNQSTKMHTAGARVFKDIFKRVLDRAEFKKVSQNGKSKNYICFHDLRHTFASHWMMSGGDLFKLQRILGHQDSKMTQRYAHLSPNAFAGDLARLEMY